MNVPSFKSLAVLWILLLVVIIVNVAYGLTQSTPESANLAAQENLQIDQPNLQPHTVEELIP